MKVQGNQAVLPPKLPGTSPTYQHPHTRRSDSALGEISRFQVCLHKSFTAVCMTIGPCSVSLHAVSLLLHHDTGGLRVFTSCRPLRCSSCQASLPSHIICCCFHDRSTLIRSAYRRCFGITSQAASQSSPRRPHLHTSSYSDTGISASFILLPPYARSATSFCLLISMPRRRRMQNV